MQDLESFLHGCSLQGPVQQMAFIDFFFFLVNNYGNTLVKVQFLLLKSCLFACILLGYWLLIKHI